ncbi:MAG: hypothetical protein WCO84_08885 [bacterium]
MGTPEPLALVKIESTGEWRVVFNAEDTLELQDSASTVVFVGQIKSKEEYAGVVKCLINETDYSVNYLDQVITDHHRPMGFQMDYKPNYDQSVWDDYMRSCMGDVEPLERATKRMGDAMWKHNHPWPWSRWWTNRKRRGSCPTEKD